MNAVQPNTAKPQEPSARPFPLGSLVAAAKRITSEKLERQTVLPKAEGWQTDAWEMYDAVGEQRFLASTLANRMGQARIFVGLKPDNPTEEVEPIFDGPAAEVFEALPITDQHVTRMGVNLFMAGDCTYLGVPDPDRGQPSSADTGWLQEARQVHLDSLSWGVCSVDEVTYPTPDRLKLTGITIGSDDRTEYAVDETFPVRVWRPHPRFWSLADSPTRSSLPVLREVVGLTMHVGAQIDSRLAGAGVLLIPQSADRVVRIAAGLPENGPEASPLVESLMDAMLTPIKDRDSASALVPIMPTVPDESIEKFRYMSFATPLDGAAKEMRDEAIRRLALGQDCPPELLLGVGSMNHWGAWLVREDVVTTHLMPPLALICDALTTQYLWPVLEQRGMSKVDRERFVIWFDVEHLILRPNRSADAAAGHAAGVISDEAYRDALGFDESDAPPDPGLNRAESIVLGLIRQSPALAANPGIPVLLEQVGGMLQGGPTPSPAEDAASGPDSDPEGVPDSGDTEAPEIADMPGTDAAPATEIGPSAEGGGPA